MAELPASFNLKTKKRPDGKLDIVGKDDLGAEYRVRTTDGPQITEKDVQELKAADRESYANSDQGCRAFIKGLKDFGDANKAKREDAYMDELMEASGPVIHAGFERKGSTVGSSPTYRKNFNSVFGDN